MRTTKLIIASLSALIIAVCCTKEKEEAKAVYSHSFTVEAELPGIEQEPDSKGYLGSYISATWTEGDKVSVVNLSTGKILGGNLIADKSGTRTTFSGTVNGTISKGNIIALFHPSFEKEQETDFGAVKMDISNQNPSTGVPLVAYGAFTADSASGTVSGLKLDFYYMLSYLKINISSLPVKSNVSKVVLRNIPSEFTIEIDSDKTGFKVATPEEKTANGKITVNGAFQTSESGTMTIAVGVMPSAKAARTILATVDDEGDFLAPLTSAELSSHKYYNTIASLFEKVGLSGINDYGIYNLSSGATLDRYDEFKSTVIVGQENGKSDFSMLDTGNFSYWTISGIPADAAEGTSFTADINGYGISEITKPFASETRVMMEEKDEDGTKLWLKASPYLFIIRK